MNNNFETKRNQFFIERLKKRTKWVVTCLQAMNNQNLKSQKRPSLLLTKTSITLKIDYDLNLPPILFFATLPLNVQTICFLSFPILSSVDLLEKSNLFSHYSFIHSFIHSSINHLINSSTHQLNNSSTHQLINSSTHQLINLSIH